MGHSGFFLEIGGGGVGPLAGIQGFWDLWEWGGNMR